MAYPHITNGGDGLQVWRVAASMLDKQLLAADRGSPPVWRLGEG